MSVTLRELAELVQGTVVGDSDLPITGARTLAEARAGDITFVENDKHLPQLAKSLASAAVVSAQISLAGRPHIQVKDPLAAFVAIFQHLQGRPPLPIHGIDLLTKIHPTVLIGADASVHPLASIGEGTLIGDRCRLYPGCVIGRDCRLGDDVTLHPNVVLYDGCIVGNRVTIHANSTIGADGFGYRFQNGRHAKVPQLGHVEIADDVEIGANTTIDRGAFQATRIGVGTKIDNLVQVAHNCQIGAHNLFVSQMGIAGSSSTGDYVVVAGQVGIADHVHIGERAVVAARSGVPSDVPAGETVLGAPARPVRDQKRILLTLDKLPEMRRDLERVKKHLGLEGEGRGGHGTRSEDGQDQRQAG
ncbi:MAG: UDP-3-O-(3-hydroxymyristoyl)glucosamine N-acyltransferase [Planctomycetia bacterium]|nr:UDP-3-O-(3-hydroxymyristoyl)glucosamine N-acyltransferase [Planctomycetia bacterium]